MQRVAATRVSSGRAAYTSPALCNRPRVADNWLTEQGPANTKSAVRGTDTQELHHPRCGRNVWTLPAVRARRPVAARCAGRVATGIATGTALRKRSPPGHWHLREGQPGSTPSPILAAAVPSKLESPGRMFVGGNESSQPSRHRRKCCPCNVSILYFAAAVKPHEVRPGSVRKHAAGVSCSRFRRPEAAATPSIANFVTEPSALLCQTSTTGIENRRARYHPLTSVANERSAPGTDPSNVPCERAKRCSVRRIAFTGTPTHVDNRIDRDRGVDRL